jgi:RNA polymerase-binding transcription factor DksA
MSHHAHKLILLERLRALDARLEGIEAELEAPHSKDWDEMAVEREGEEVLERLGEQGLAEVAQIKAALARMARGDYAICTRCGDEISAERLNLLPETPLCKSCAAGV